MPDANESERAGVAVGLGVRRQPQPLDCPAASGSMQTSRTSPQSHWHKARFAVRSQKPMRVHAP